MSMPSSWSVVLVIFSLLAATAPSSAQVTLIAADAAPEAAARIYVSPADMAQVTVYSFFRPRQERSPVDLAIEDLVDHLRRMSGVTVQVVQTDDAQAVKTPALVIGALARQFGDPPPATADEESYRIQTRAGRVLVLGERNASTAYGVYGLLKLLGCDWVMPGEMGLIVPESKTVAVPATDQVVVPDFVFRWMWIGGKGKRFPDEARQPFEQWVRRQRMGTADWCDSRRGEAHMWNKVVLKYKQELAANPQMLALVRQPDGTFKREGPQLETANPDTVALVGRYIREQFEQFKWPKDKMVTLAIGPADGLGYSESPESRAAGVERRDVTTGGADQTDLVVKLANDVLDLIGAEFPNLTLGYYVYSVHSEFPARYTPHPRIRPIFAPISYSRLHSTVDPHSRSRAYYRSIVERWVAHARQHQVPLMVYEYNWNLADNFLPFTRIRTIAEDCRFYKEQGFFGITMQAINAWEQNAAGDYIYANMLWDTAQDWRTLLREFCDKSYGAAADDLERYYLRLVETQSSAGLEAGSYYSAPLIFDRAYLAAARADLDAAANRADLTEPQRFRVNAVRLAFDSLTIYLDWHDATTRFDFAAAQRGIDALKANYAARKQAYPNFADYAAGIYLSRLLGQSTEESLKYSSAPYHVLKPLPDELPTHLDPNHVGARFNLFGVAIRDEFWQRTKTYSSTWDAQGLGMMRETSVWYRHRFDVPVEVQGQGVGLLLGAFDDEARIWVNGAFVGSTGVKFPQAAAIDLTDAIRFGQSNLLTIQIKRNSTANEIGTGGILRPGFIFAGPRVQTPEPPAQRVRVLPGGDLEIIPETKP